MRKVDYEILENPEFEKAGKIMDWRNYVPIDYKSTWEFLGLEAKKAIYILCKDRADAEEWE